MRNRHIAILGAAALATGWLVAVPVGAAERALDATARSDLAVTVYGNGLGLVSDRRRVQLSKGINMLSVGAMSPAMIKDSLLAGFDNTRVGARVTAMTHGRDRANQRDIMRANISKPGYLVRVHPVTGADVVIPATLISVDGGVIARIGDKVVLNPEGRWAFDNLPDGLVADAGANANTGAGLTVAVSADADGQGSLDLRYLSDGLKWHPAHTAEWSDADGMLSLNSWAVIDNATGIDFNGAWLRLVAGQVSRMSRPVAPRPMARTMQLESAARADAAGASAPSREALGGYHLYRLPATVDLADGTSQQVPLMAEIRVKAERKLISEGYPQAYGPARTGGDPTHPMVRLVFTLPADKGAEPLPAGTVRLFGRDRRGVAQFLGEDHIDDTPTGGKAQLEAGRAFDVTVSRTQTSFERESRQLFESGQRVQIHNGGARAVKLDVIEALPGDWTILQADHPHERDGGRARWRIDVPAGGDVVLNYRVRVRT